MEKYFFEIPIYRCSPEKHSAELDILHEQISQDFESQRETLPEYDFTQNTQNSFARKAYEYEYNEIIGWIRLYILGTQIRGRYYFETDPTNREVIKKRFNKGIRKKKFEDIGKAFELSIEKELNSNEIFVSLLGELERLSKKEKPFINKYFDLEQLKNIGAFVDWRKLFEELNPFAKKTEK